MKWLFWNIRSWFCSHKWEFAEREFEIHFLNRDFVANNTKVSATCLKCGWHRKYEKF